MRILMVNRSRGQEGGVERYLTEVSRLLRGNGDEVWLLYGQGRPAESEAAYSRSFAVPALWSGRGAGLREALAEVETVLKHEAVDVAYLHDIERAAVTSHLVSRVPTVRYVHDFKATCPDGKRLLSRPSSACDYPLSAGCFLRAHTRRCMPRSPTKALKAYRRSARSLAALSGLSAILVASRFMKTMLTRHGMNDGKITVVPYFCRWGAEHWRQPERPRGLLFVGRLVGAKGVLGLLDVLAQMDTEVRLDIVGDGPDRVPIERRIEALSLQKRATMCGWLDGEVLKQRYRRNAVLVVPSLWPEPFGMVGVEAAAVCRPAVAFDVGGVKEWLQHERTGYLVQAQRWNELRVRIEALLDHPELAKQMGLAASREVTRRFSPDAHLTDLIRLLRKARGRRGALS